MRRIRSLKDVVEWGLCTGCGACACAPGSNGGVTLVNIENVGIRPHFNSAAFANSAAGLAVCPGYEVNAELAIGARAERSEADHEFGAALEIWEGYAADPELRYRASSGGALSALALYCLEQEAMRFVLHTGPQESQPWLNKTVQSRTRDEILSRTGSRYAPASPCEGLRAIEEADGPCVFIGKPCDATAAFKMRQVSPRLDRNLGLVLSFFCAGTPSTRGTLDLIQSLEFKPADVQNLHYRGQGWPGRFTVSNGAGRDRSLSYAESWGELTRYRPQRCHICPDGLGRVSDIACGDAWDKFEENGDAGRSLILVRTERGRAILKKAVAAGYLVVVSSSAAQVRKAQANLLARRREIFGRLVGMALLGVPIPRLAGFSLWRAWMQLSLKIRVRTIVGTMTRLVQRGQWRRQRLTGR